MSFKLREAVARIMVPYSAPQVRDEKMVLPGVRESRGLAYPRTGLATDLSQHRDVISGRSTLAGGTTDRRR
jgi:hypothetical protein